MRDELEILGKAGAGRSGRNHRCDRKDQQGISNPGLGAAGGGAGQRERGIGRAACLVLEHDL